MRQEIDKKLVRVRFRRALKTYNRFASVQKTMAERLTELIVSHAGGAFRHVFEIGCGTGLLTARLADTLHWEKYTANDLVPECRICIQEIDPRIEFLPGDVESAVLPSSPADLIVSNAVLQWASDLPLFLARLSESLAPRGTLACATFTAGTAREMAEAGGVSLAYPTAPQLEDACEPYVRLEHHESATYTQSFDSPADILRQFSRTGSNAVTDRPWTRGDVSLFADRYHSLYGADVHLTYHALFFLARREDA